MKISPALYHLWGDDAARAVVLMALEFSLGRLDPLLHGVHVEARALLHLRKFDECLGIFTGCFLNVDAAPELVHEEIKI
jgi:hypothetical protein